MSKSSVKFSLVNPHAAGIDVGSRSHWVCAGAGKIKEYKVFTEDLHQMARWLKSLGIQTIAMESTGYYWKSLFLLLQDYGFEVILVHAAHVKNVRGKKSDMLDCQWIWQLHSAGLLSASFQPDNFTESLRAYTRHRKSLIDGAARYISKMQKAMIVQNIHLSVVLTDITGKSGKAIIAAILAGERDGKKLAALADRRVKASKEDIAKALTGHWKEQHLFELKQSWEMYHFYHTQIQECDLCIEKLLDLEVNKQHLADLAYEPKKKKKRAKNDPQFDLAQKVYQLAEGKDLLEIDGVGYGLLFNLLAEVGLDLSKFSTAKHFVSWLCLCPNKRITGGKVISSKTRKNQGRLAYAFRQAANAVGNQKDTALSSSFRSLASRRGRKVAITATARKIATTVYNVLEKGQAYQPMGTEEYQKLVRLKKIRNIQRTMRKHQIELNELGTI